MAIPVSRIFGKVGNLMMAISSLVFKKQDDLTQTLSLSQVPSMYIIDGTCDVAMCAKGVGAYEKSKRIDFTKSLLLSLISFS